MLPRNHKLTSPAQFSRTIKNGTRAGSSYFVVYLWKNTAEIASFGGPRCGLIVSKAVGNAVTRHSTSRRLRHVFFSLIDALPTTAQVVVRALPRAAGASTRELEREMKRLIHKLLSECHD